MAIICFGIAISILFLVIAVLITNPSKQFKPNPPTIEDIQRKYPSHKSLEQTRAITQPARNLQTRDSHKYRKLLNMVGGNRKTADRLVAAYGIDKAILDLERDRRIN